MKAKKVYEFINPEEDEVSLDKGFPLGKLNIIKKKLINYFKINPHNIEIGFKDNLIIAKIKNSTMYVECTKFSIFSRVSSFLSANIV